VISAHSPLDHVTPYDRFAWSDTHIERWLASGEHAAELNAYFGAAEYRALTALARRAQRAVADDPALRVFIVPGIMGSQLGLRRQPPLPHDILWIDPIDIERGRLAALRLPGTARIVSLGVVLFSYLRLKLYLRSHGFSVEFHDYDWRLPVTQLGQAFAARLRSAASAPVAIVAHSIGGLVARAALTHLESRQVQRVLLLGTPNRGSFAAVQALRGTYAVVRKVARLDSEASAETLTSEVFSSFPSLYDLLPRGTGSADLFDPTLWPTSGPRPRVELLQAARVSREQFAPADERFTVIAGVGQETVTAIARVRDEFVYTLTRHGDGTVPTSSATLAGARSAFARVAHSDLTRDPLVAAAVVDILRKGHTQRLPDRWGSASRARVRISDRQLRRTHADKVDWAALAPEQRRLFLENLNEPPHLKLRVPRAARRQRP
jgi:pimeloyl-ACP methyl ester carboxylesterase